MAHLTLAPVTGSTCSSSIIFNMAMFGKVIAETLGHELGWPRDYDPVRNHFSYFDNRMVPISGDYLP